MSQNEAAFVPGPAMGFGPDNMFDVILDDLRGVSMLVRLVAPSGEEIEVCGVNCGSHIHGHDGTVYPFRSYKVADIY